ncbi:nuclear transport factor 2 family protein [Rhizobium pusense]|uniref:nuclear transport factor 2 family protein n=1 Tax=Agrobacterium pusense TaxID=648995 RepID=UPI001FCD70B4|nr:nuclear transport factor 2 family protein [Agrobacterium pusense]MCJ2877610.1 nuclear transport factor 2 family protein [Agrobacterium pusense]
MTNSSGQAQAIAQAYINAIANKDIDMIVSISAEDVICNAPVGNLQGVERFRGFHEGFARMIVKITALAVFGNDDQAVVIYEAETHPVPHSTVAEYIKVKDGKIISTDVIYDSVPFAEYQKTKAPH